MPCTPQATAATATTLLRRPHRPAPTPRRYIVVTNPHIKKVYNQYYVSFGERRSLGGWAGGTRVRAQSDGRGLKQRRCANMPRPPKRCTH